MIGRVDAYGNLLDALPLAGQTVVGKVLRGECANEEQLVQAVEQACEACPAMAELILHGENYVGMSLFEAGREALADAVGRDSDAG